MTTNKIICFVFILFLLSTHLFAIVPISQKSMEYNRKGEVEYKVKKYNEAVLFFEKAVELDTNNFHAYSNLGVVYQKIGKLNDAIEANNSAILKTDDNNIKAASYYNIARIYEKLEKWSEALKSYQNALKYRKHSAYKKGISRVRKKISSDDEKSNIDPKRYVDSTLKKIQYPETLWLVRQSYEFSNDGCTFYKYWMTPTSGEENKEKIPIAKVRASISNDGILMECIKGDQCIKVTTDHGYKGKEKKSFILPNTKDLKVVIGHFNVLNQYCNK